MRNIKRVGFGIVLLVLIFPYVVFADSAPKILFDTKGYITCEVTLETTEAEIGDEVSYQCLVKNNADFTIGIWEFAGESFRDSQIILKPGRSVVLESSFKIEPTNDWHKVGDEYYIDFYEEVRYEAYDTDLVCEYSPYVYDYIENALRITNLKDGSGYLHIEISQDNQNMLFFDGYHDMLFEENSELLNIEGGTTGTVIIKNVSRKK